MFTGQCEALSAVELIPGCPSPAAALRDTTGMSLDPLAANAVFTRWASFGSILLTLSDPHDGSWAHSKCIKEHVCGSAEIAQVEYDKMRAGGETKFMLPSGIHLILEPCEDN